MSSIRISCREVSISPENRRVLLRPFFPGSFQRVNAILARALGMDEEDVLREMKDLLEAFAHRHIRLEPFLQAQYDKVLPYVDTLRPPSRERQLFIGALFSGEYALESAALFNPSLVPHPDQGGVPEGSLRFIMSLRATGEGHISSIEFRTGLIGPDGAIRMDPVTGFVSLPERVPNPTYRKKRFMTKMRELGLQDSHALAVMGALGDVFTLEELEHSVWHVRREVLPVTPDLHRTLECVQWLADSNYELIFPPSLKLDERCIFPVSPNESSGIEDARFVRFMEEDGSVLFYATYTAYNGRAILPQLIETGDFLHFRVLTLNGSAVQDKGMALFPRRIQGRYAMLSRQDDENIFIMFSDNPHHWSDPHPLLRPLESWEISKIGNCGSPIETEAGWLVLTHGVGPMRKYCIGAALLDLDDPTKVLGRLREPLLMAAGDDRDGYVPNVVYSCGALLHGRQLVVPYAMNDRTSTIVSVSLDDLLEALQG